MRERVRRQVAARRPDIIAPLPTAIAGRGAPAGGRDERPAHALIKQWTPCYFTADAARAALARRCACRRKACSARPTTPRAVSTGACWHRPRHPAGRATAGAGASGKAAGMTVSLDDRAGAQRARRRRRTNAIAIAQPGRRQRVVRVARAGRAAAQLAGQRAAPRRRAWELRVGVREKASVIDLTVEDSGHNAYRACGGAPRTGCASTVSPAPGHGSGGHNPVVRDFQRQQQPADFAGCLAHPGRAARPAALACRVIRGMSASSAASRVPGPRRRLGADRGTASLAVANSRWRHGNGAMHARSAKPPAMAASTTPVPDGHPGAARP